MAELPALRDPYFLAAVAGIIIAFGLGGYLGCEYSLSRTLHAQTF